jgi:hypothetical protein
MRGFPVVETTGTICILKVTFLSILANWQLLPSLLRVREVRIRESVLTSVVLPHTDPSIDFKRPDFSNLVQARLPVTLEVFRSGFSSYFKPTCFSWGSLTLGSFGYFLMAFLTIEKDISINSAKKLLTLKVL